MKKIVLLVTALTAGWLYAQVPHTAPLDTIRDGEREITYFYYNNWERICKEGYKYEGYSNYTSTRALRFHTDSLLRVCGIAICATPSNDDFYMQLGNCYTGSILRLQIFEAGNGSPVQLAEATGDVNTASRWIEVYGYESDPGISNNTPPGPKHYRVYPVTEVYFDSTVTVNDSFYVGWSVNPPSDHHQYDGAFMNILSWTGISTNNDCMRVHDPASYQFPEVVFNTVTETWSYFVTCLPYLPFIFPIIDSTGWYLYCDTMVCPRIKDLNVSTDYGMAVCSWLGDTLDGHGEWQLSYGPVGTEPGGGRVITTYSQSHVLSGLDDTMAYVAYVRGKCTRCDKWGEWSYGVEFRLREPEGVQSPEEMGEGVRVQPNPTSGKAEVQASIGMHRVTVFDAQGTQVLTQRVSGTVAELDLGGNPSGVYLVAVYTPKGIVCKKLVVE